MVYGNVWVVNHCERARVWTVRRIINHRAWICTYKCGEYPSGIKHVYIIVLYVAHIKHINLL